MKFELTKQLKEDWLKALKSGEFEQYGEALQNRNNTKQKCCLGVLAYILNLDITPNGYWITLEGKNVLYEPFDQMGLTKQCFLAKANDSSYKKGVRDYSEVIPLIEQLQTVD